MRNYFGYNICCMCVFSQRKANILLLSSCCNQIRFCQNIFTASHSSCTVAPCFFEQEKVVATYKNKTEKQKVFFALTWICSIFSYVYHFTNSAKITHIFMNSIPLNHILLLIKMWFLLNKFYFELQST